MQKYTAPGINSEPDDSAYNDIFIRPYFEDDWRTVFGTVSTTFLVVKKESIQAKEITWNFDKNEEIKEGLAKMESLKQTLIHTEGQEEEGQKLEELKILSTKVMEQFKTA